MGKYIGKAKVGEGSKRGRRREKRVGAATDSQKEEYKYITILDKRTRTSERR